MLQLIEAHYLSIEWQEPSLARRIEVDPYPIEIQLAPNGGKLIETQIFHDFHPWLGIRLNDILAGQTPSFVNAQGEQRLMLAITDGRGDVWWVQNDGWDTVGQRHLSELHRTIGRFEIVIGDQCLFVENVAMELNRTQIEEYLRDFKQDLIWLVMGFGSGTATGGASLVDSKLVEALANFSTVARRVVNNPDKNMRETVAEAPIARLRPNAATFRHYARMPSAQHLMGRVTEITADIADNGYLRHMLKVCKKLTRTVALSVEQQTKSFGVRAQGEAERSAAYIAMNSRLIDPEIFTRQQDELKEKLDRVTNFTEISQRDESDSIRNFKLIVEGRYGHDKNRLFFKKSDGKSDYDKINNIEFNVIEIPSELLNLINTVLSFSNEYTLRGTAEISIELTSKEKKYRLVCFSHVESVVAHTKALEKKQRRRLLLEKNGWRVSLSKQEREEMGQEARTAKLREKVYLERAARAVAAAAALKACQTDMHSQDHLWQQLGVAPRPIFPMGMRYTQNTDYVACLAAFNRVRELAERSGIGEVSLEELDRIGILHASAIYERWCLVKILSVLIEDYGFNPEPGWQDRLIHAVTGISESLCLTFQRQDIEMMAILEIQPIFPNGRRPDFRLSFRDSQNLSGRKKGIVMDAKFRTKWQKGALDSMLDELVSVKSYGQFKDRVFILQPAARAMAKATSPLEWGRNCNYGQDEDHRNGTIQLAPGDGTRNPIVNLRRLIAMELQASFDPPVKNEFSLWTSKSFCIRCGKKHTSSDIFAKSTRKGQVFWVLNCTACYMKTTRTHCMGAECKTVLFKNGIYLTYHKTLADQVTNIVCPSCGAHFDSDWKTEDGDFDTRNNFSL